MFVGAVPKPVVEQITRIVPIAEWGSVFVGCSGSFRVDRAVKQKCPEAKVYSNDVSLLSVALGKLAVGEEMRIDFRERLAFIEERLGPDAPYASRVAAILVALEMAKHKGTNAHAQAHFRHYRENFADYHGRALDRCKRFAEETTIDGFYAGDFLEQVPRAVEAGGGVMAFPPTYRLGYERLYKFLADNTDWDQPEYGIWDPAQIGEWIGELDAAGVRFCVLSDQMLAPALQPKAEYFGSMNKPVYLYADSRESSLRRDAVKERPFAYKGVDSARLTPESEVQLVPADAGQMNFLKNKYLAKGIIHVAGMLNFLVFVDGMLVGGFIYTRGKFGSQEDLYLLSDFSISRERKLSKLVAMLASSRLPVDVARKRYVLPIKRVFTTAFTTRPVSMKYRGIFDLVGRKPGFLNYASSVREQSPNDIYKDWWRRFAAKDEGAAGQAE